MPFVDAHRYLKVQDQDLDESFNAKSSHDGVNSRDETVDKYSKASFESFELEPTRFDKPRNYKKYLVPGILMAILTVLIIVGLILFFVLIVAKNMGDAELGFDENGEPYTAFDNS